MVQVHPFRKGWEKPSWKSPSRLEPPRMEAFWDEWPSLPEALVTSWTIWGYDALKVEGLDLWSWFFDFGDIL